MRLVTYPDLSRKYGITYSRRQLQRLEGGGQFPCRLKLGCAAQARVAWNEKEVEEWLINKAKQRGKGGAAA